MSTSNSRNTTYLYDHPNLKEEEGKKEKANDKKNESFDEVIDTMNKNKTLKYQQTQKQTISPYEEQKDLSYTIWRRINPTYVLPPAPLISTTKDTYRNFDEKEMEVDKSFNRTSDKFSNWREEDLKSMGKLAKDTFKGAAGQKPWKF
ncbi:hypothetical protein ABK040_011965 [Willaertia magna]